MDFYQFFNFIPIMVMLGFIFGPVLLIWLLIRIFNYTEIDKNGRRYGKKMFFSGRICPGCGLKILTDIPTCPSCDRDFSKDSEGSNVQHKDTL